MEFGVAWVHERMTRKELAQIRQCYELGAVKVLVSTFDMSWSLSDLSADLVIVQDPEKYNAVEKRYQPLSVATLLQMQSLAISSDLSGAFAEASRPTGQAKPLAKCVIMCHTPKKDYFAKLVSEPLPVESTLPQNLHEHLNTAIVSGDIENIQDAIDWITWTFMYRRIAKNPNYYEISGRTGQHINDYLSELVEDTVAELAEAGCVTVKENEMDLEPANMGRIAAFYCLKYATAEAFARALNTTDPSGKPVSLKMKQLLEILCQSAEFQGALECTESDETLLRQLALNLPFDIPSAADFTDPHIVANILLQCHFGRKPVPASLRHNL